MFNTTATVQVKNPKGEVVAKQDYEKVVFEGTALDDKGKVIAGDAEAMLGAAIGFYQAKYPTENGVLKLLADATYAYDLGRRASIRQQLVTAAEGPDKAIAKAVKDLMTARASMGKPITEEAALAKVMVAMAD